MEIKEFEGKRYLQSNTLLDQSFVRHLFSTRDFGNMGLHTGDVPEEVWKHRKAVAGVLGTHWKNIVSGQQVHGLRIHIAVASDLGRGSMVYMDGIPDCDGLITNTPEVPLLGFFADCTPIFLVDPIRRAVGILHGGWKGTLSNVAGAGVEAMTKAFGSVPRDLIAVIGPRIGVECYPVSAEIIHGVQGLGLGDGLFHQEDHLDLGAINEALLRKAGVLRIEVDDHCTCCSGDLFYSHRCEKGNIGRMAGMIMVKEGMENDGY